jgi:predicted transcriptional regulator
MPKRKNPETSNEAYRSLQEVEITATQQKICSALEVLLTGTYEDIADFLKMDAARIWKRMSELHRFGLIHRTGERKIMKSGRAGFVWAPGGTPEPVKKKERVMKGKTVVDYSKAILNQPERLF